MSALPPPPTDESIPPPGEATGDGRRIGRMPPHSLEAEVSVLGSAMLSRHALSAVTEALQPEDFYRSAHATVFEAIRSLAADGDAVDTVTVLEWLRSRHRLDEVGGPAAVSDLVAAAPTAANAEYYARIVKDNALLRRLIEAGTKVVQMGFEDTEDAVATVDRAEQEIFRVSEQGVKSEYSSLKEMLPEAFERLEILARDNSEVTGLPTGFDDLDRLTAGLQPENLIILAARPAMGKCVVGSTRVVLSDGRRVPIDQLVEAGEAGKPVEVLSLGADGLLAASTPTEFHDNGVRDVVRLTTRYGHGITATPDHPFLTPSGWRHLDQLQPGDLVAAPRRVPVQASHRISEAEVRILGYLLGDGGLTGRTPVITTASAAIEEEVSTIAPALGCEVTTRRNDTLRTLVLRGAVDLPSLGDVGRVAGVSATTAGSVLREDGRVRVSDATRHRVRAAASRLGHETTPTRNHLTAWLEELGLMGAGAHEKFVPELVHRLADDQVATFLSRLYACDGSALVAEGHGYVGISYTSVSEVLARDVQHLLLRLGIVARCRPRSVPHTDTAGRATRRRAFEIEIRDATNVLRFLDVVGIFSKEDACARVRAAASTRGRHTNTDLLPIDVWQDVLWDEVVSVAPAGSARVYDLTVPGDHNFVADDLIVHNSSLALNLAQYVTVALHKPAIVFSLEMSKIEIVNRMLSAEAGIDSERMKTGRFDDRDWRRLGDALGRLGDAPLYIDDTPSISMIEIAAKCRRLKDRHGLELVIVDYLQLMQSHRRVDSRQQEVAEISRALKMLAKDLKVPVIALSQLSRQPESRVDKRPMLADLRESGSIEQDADIVGFIYRDEVYDDQSPKKGIAELIISKHRNGRVGTIELAFLNHLTKFANLRQQPRRSDGGMPPMAPVPDSPL